MSNYMWPYPRAENSSRSQRRGLQGSTERPSSYNRNPNETNNVGASEHMSDLMAGCPLIDQYGYTDDCMYPGHPLSPTSVWPPYSVSNDQANTTPSVFDSSYGSLTDQSFRPNHQLLFGFSGQFLGNFHSTWQSQSGHMPISSGTVEGNTNQRSPYLNPYEQTTPALNHGYGNAVNACDYPDSSPTVGTEQNDSYNLPTDCQGSQFCDKPACDEAFPCQRSSLSDSNQSLFFDPHCAKKPHDEDICCEDQCPGDSQCEDHCYDPDCDFEPCLIDHSVDDLNLDGLDNDDACRGCIDPQHLPNDRPFTESFEAEAPLRLTNQQTILEGWNTGDSFDLPIHESSYMDIFEESSMQIDPSGNTSPQHASSCTPSTIGRSPTRQSQIIPSHDASPESSTGLACKWTVDLATNAICGRQFSNVAELHMHCENDHINRLPRANERNGSLYCFWQGCSRGFTDGFPARPKLKRHVMTHTNHKPFSCPDCSMKMKTKDAMDKHRRTHSGQKPFDCGEPGCRKSFATSTELANHSATHTGAKPHRCHICGEAFADSSNLSKHKKTHEVGKYICPVCKIRMKRWDQMRRHMKSQNHRKEIVKDDILAREYKHRMEMSFAALTPEQRQIRPDQQQRHNERRQRAKQSNKPPKKEEE